MKRNKKSIKVIFLSVFIALVVIAIAGMNMRTLINSNGVTRIAKKAGANDAIAQDVLENYTFTSDTAGINQEGTIKDYSEYEGRFKLLATAAPESKIYNLTLNPGYYTHINVDATDVYNEGHDAGYDEGMEAGANAAYDHVDDGPPILSTTFTGNTWTGTINTEIGEKYEFYALTLGLSYRSKPTNIHM